MVFFNGFSFLTVDSRSFLQRSKIVHIVNSYYLCASFSSIVDFYCCVSFKRGVRHKAPANCLSRSKLSDFVVSQCPSICRSKLLGNDTRRIGAGSPRIVRPVTRPPRRRPYNEGESPTIDVAQDIPCDEEVCNSPANRLAAACGIDEHRSEQQDLKGHVSLFNRNTSLPPDVATPMGLSKQPGDTALIQVKIR